MFILYNGLSMKKYFISIDEGTTSTRSVIFNDDGKIVGIESERINLYYPGNGLVEFNPLEIYNAVLRTLKKSMENAGIDSSQICSIGITNQRESIIIWNKRTGIPVYNGISWQDKRKMDIPDFNNYKKLIRRRTGLVANPYFSAMKIKWVLNNVKDELGTVKNGDLLAGTMDSWILWKLTNGAVHATDHTNASRTMLFNISKLSWDDDLLEIFKIPRDILPEVHSSTHNFGYAKINGNSIPVMAMAGDQSASMVGQNALSNGNVKNTYGTGSFIMANTGKRILNAHGLISTVAYSLNDGCAYYALEGSIFNSGSAFEWALKALNGKNTGYNLDNKNDVYFVPAFSGLGSPYWNDGARGMFIGITRNTGNKELISAVIKSIAFQVEDVIRIIRKKLGIIDLRCDGGSSRNDELMRFQARLSGINVLRSENPENTAAGIFYLNAVSSGIMKIDDIKHLWKFDRIFKPDLNPDSYINDYLIWRRAVRRSLNWIR
ncbi:glycerol kinase GlpK [Acidiplasma sp.]|uniref:FGGY family carbohydrate kinase n=1 Tax=Acidiplasma sp. TaxID=1872114 RepID=UPI00316690BC